MKDNRARAMAANSIKARQSVPLAGALDWSADLPSLNVTLHRTGPRVIGDIGYTSAQLFDVFSQARSDPLASFYVNGTSGNDANNGLTAGTAFRSASAAQAAANAAGVRSVIYCQGQIYYGRTNAWNSGATVPTVDTVYVAQGGRVSFATYDGTFSVAQDGTYTNTYSTTVSNGDFCLDRLSVDQFGYLREMPVIDSATILNTQVQDGFFIDGTKGYMRRRDGKAVSQSNTFLLRPVHNYLNNGNVSVMFMGETSRDYFEFLGGGLTNPTSIQAKGCVNLRSTTLPGSKVAYVFDNCKFRYGLRSMSVDSIHGYAAFYNCEFGHSMEDGFNIHHELPQAAATRAITVNCRGIDFGRTSGGGQSCNAWTLHEDCEALDVAGWYNIGRGGLIRDIGSSKAVLAGTRVGTDLGDQVLSGNNPPIIIRADDTAQIWMDSVEYLPDCYGAQVYAAGTSTIRYRNMPAPLGGNFGPGTVAPWV